MEKVSCVVMEDNIFEFLNEIETQLGKGITCCKCKVPCEKNSRCYRAMQNLLTDIDLFKKAYSEIKPNEKTVEQETVEQVVEKVIEKQVLND